MKWVFWISLSVIAYTYFAYPLWLYLRRRWRSRPVQAAEMFPAVSVVMAVRDEAAVLPKKLQNLAQLDYPADRLEIIGVSDGSTDATNQILAGQASERLKVITLAEPRGKAAALNAGVQAARGEIVVFTDARQWIEPGALRALVANFADPAVGCVSGELMMGDPHSPRPLDGLGLYWRMEKGIRQWESDTGSVVGATGAFYAVRRELIPTLPVETILDDVYIPMHVARHGLRVVFESRAVAWDPLMPSPKQEFRRKVRTLTGNYQLLRMAPWLLMRENPIRFELFSHKVLRLLVPFALLAALVSSLFPTELIYRATAVAQISFYGLGLLAMAWPKLGSVLRLANAAHAFLLLNSAATVALFHFLRGTREVWAR